MGQWADRRLAVSNCRLSSRQRQQRWPSGTAQGMAQPAHEGRDPLLDPRLIPGARAGPVVIRRQGSLLDVGPGPAPCFADLLDGHAVTSLSEDDPSSDAGDAPGDGLLLPD